MNLSKCKAIIADLEVSVSEKTVEIDRCSDIISTIREENMKALIEKKLVESNLSALLEKNHLLSEDAAFKDKILLDTKQNLAQEREVVEHCRNEICLLEKKMSDMKLNIDESSLIIAELKSELSLNILKLAEKEEDATKRELELSGARAELTKQKEIILYINKLSAETAAAN